MKKKTAYIITKSTLDMPEFVRERFEAVESYCNQNGYTISAGTTLTGQPMEEMMEEIIVRLQDVKPDVLVLHSGLEFGRDESVAFGYINRIRDMGIEVEAVRMKIPEKSAMTAISNVTAVFQEMAVQFEGTDDFDGDYDENYGETGDELIMRERPAPSAEHWEALAPATKTDSRPRCVCYMRVASESCLCDDITLEEQRKKLREFAENQGYVVSDEVQAFECRSDEDSVGLKLLQKVLTEKQADTVMVMSHTVFSDDAITCKKIVDDLKNRGVAVETLEECSLRIRSVDFFQMR